MMRGRIKPLFSLLVFFTIFGSNRTHAESPHDLVARAILDAEKGNLHEAEQAFSQAAELGKKEGLDPAIAMYNLGTTQLEQGKAQDAANSFAEALHTENLDLQQKSFFARGSALTALSQAQQEKNEVGPAVEMLEESIGMYEQAMLLNPDDTDPKINYELAVRQLEQLKQLQQEQQKSEENQQDEESEEPQEQEQQDNNEQGQEDQEQNQDQQEQEQEQQQQQNQDQQNEQEKDQENESSSEQKNQPEQNQDPQSQTSAPQEMTEEEAEMLLNAMREEEDAARRQYRLQQGAPREVEKDW